MFDGIRAALKADRINNIVCNAVIFVVTKFIDMGKPFSHAPTVFLNVGGNLCQ